MLGQDEWNMYVENSYLPLFKKICVKAKKKCQWFEQIWDYSTVYTYGHLQQLISSSHLRYVVSSMDLKNELNQSWP